MAEHSEPIYQNEIIEDGIYANGDLQACNNPETQREKEGSPTTGSIINMPLHVTQPMSQAGANSLPKINTNETHVPSTWTISNTEGKFCPVLYSMPVA